MALESSKLAGGLTHKVGDLPVWAWGAALVGGLGLGWYFLKGQKAAAPATQPAAADITTGSTAAPTGAQGSAPVFCACPVCDWTTGQMIDLPQSPGCISVACPNIDCAPLGPSGPGQPKPPTTPSPPSPLPSNCVPGNCPSGHYTVTSNAPNTIRQISALHNVDPNCVLARNPTAASRGLDTPLWVGFWVCL